MTALLPIPTFLSTDPQAVLDAWISQFETTLGKALQPAQVERLLANAGAYREVITRMDVQAAALQNLAAFAIGTNLDAVALLVGVSRLANKPATTQLRFTLSAVLGADTPIPAGTRVKSNDGLWIFATNADAKILAGQLFADVPATCQVPGGAADGYAINSINVLVDTIAGVATASNTTLTTGGVDTESDEAMRIRVQLAPSAFGTAGSQKSYKFWTLSYGPEIIDAYVTSPAGGQVQVAILTNQGAPTTAQLTGVAAILSGETVRPLTDTVTVVGANQLTYTIEASLSLYTGTDQPTALAAAIAAAQAYAQARRTQLGRDVTPGQVEAQLLTIPGIYDLTLTHPATPVIAGPGDYCDCTAITITVGSVVDG